MITEKNTIPLILAIRIYECEIQQAGDDPKMLVIARNSFLGKLEKIFTRNRKE